MPEVDSMHGQGEKIGDRRIGMKGIESLLKCHILWNLPQLLQLVFLYLPNCLACTDLLLILVLGHGDLGGLGLVVEEAGCSHQHTHGQ